MIPHMPASVNLLARLLVGPSYAAAIAALGHVHLQGMACPTLARTLVPSVRTVIRLLAFRPSRLISNGNLLGP